MVSCLKTSLRSCALERGFFCGSASFQGKLFTKTAVTSSLLTKVFARLDFQTKRSVWRFPKGLLLDLEDCDTEVRKTKSAVEYWIQAIEEEKLDGYQIRRYQNNSIVAHIFNGEINGLNFDQNQLQDHNISWLIRTFPNLWSLSLKDCNVTDRGVSSLSSLNLSSLVLERCPNITGKELRLRVSTLKLKECPHLKILSNLQASEVWVSSCRDLQELKEMEVEKIVLKNCSFPHFSRIKFKELNILNLSV